MREARHLDVWTQHVLFSIHRWEFMSWMTDILEKGEAILCERYVLSGLVYSCALAPGLDIRTFMCTDMGLMAPDMVIYVDTPPEAVRARPQMSTLFSDIEFQNQIYDLFQETSIWDGIRVVRHRTSDNKWESRQRLMGVIRGDPLWKLQIEHGIICGKRRDNVPCATSALVNRKNVNAVWNAYTQFISAAYFKINHTRGYLCAQHVNKLQAQQILRHHYLHQKHLH